MRVSRTLLVLASVASVFTLRVISGEEIERSVIEVAEDAETVSQQEAAEFEALELNENAERELPKISKYYKPYYKVR